MPAPAPTRLDGFQVLQHSFEESTGRIRVDAVVSATGTEVDISHTEDSVALGDGTDLYSSHTVGSDVGLDVYLLNPELDVNITGIETLGSDNLSMPLANTEYSYVFPTTTKKFMFKLKDRKSTLEYTYTSGSNYITLQPNVAYESDRLDLTSTLTVYFKADQAAQTLEIEKGT